MRRRPSPLSRFWIHPVKIVGRTGQDEDGADVYAAPVTVFGFAEETNRIVRTAQGAEVVSTAQFYAPAGTTVALESRVTLPSGRVTRVISLERHDSAALGLPDHVTLNLE